MMLRHTTPRLLSAVLLLIATACQDAPAPLAPSDGSQAAGATQDRLAAWFVQASPSVLALSGTVFADHDEQQGRLVFGVESASVIPAVQRVLANLGIPAHAYSVEVTQPIRHMATLRDRFRPTQGGIQIHFGQYLCTLGFNVSHAAGRSFITNSHCTERQGGEEGTEYFQPTSSVDPQVIATEADDPDYFRGGVCPRGRKCRYSDSSRALYSGDVASSQGEIARTTGPNNGSLEVAGAFTVTGQDDSTSDFPIGLVVNKVGRTTGWTQGEVTRTCVHTNVSGSNVTQLCQTFVGANVAGGDSGSPVFRITAQNDVTLLGILWGGSSDGSLYVFSPLKQIQQELGALTATL